jgi:hypothetical protein
MRTRANAFAQRWAGETSERAEAQTFWNEFLDIYGVDRKRVALFEKYAERGTTGKTGRIDLFWPKVLIAEHKSLGKSLIDAEKQALDYLVSIGQEDFPGAVLTSDFQALRVLDLEKPGASPYELKIADLGSEFERFAYLAGYSRKTFEFELEANVQASELMGEIYDTAEQAGFSPHEASILLPRLLFLMFGDDTGLWPRAAFQEFIETRTQKDGSDVGAELAMLFQILNTPIGERTASLDEVFLPFPYVNGGLFADAIKIGAFNSAMRKTIIRATRFDWSRISPAIFGSLFQSVKSKELRRELGEHYTTETAIMRVIGPLFLDELRERLFSAKGSPQKLRNLRKQLATYNFLDPACGCGNFLIVAYREMRRLELDILKQLRDLKEDSQLSLDPTLGLQVSIAQFAGIEIEEWPAKVAETAMFLVDHQMNLELAEEFGLTPDRLPITSMLNVRVDNALGLDWRDVSAITDNTIIMGNPPFLGASMLSAKQQEDVDRVWGDLRGAGHLDYVTCWYKRAAEYVGQSMARIAFVSTNSISQGQQPPVMWPELRNAGFDIDFAHRTFDWVSEAKGGAAVHVIILGFSRRPKPAQRPLYFYDDLRGQPRMEMVRQINPYLVEASWVTITSQRTPLQSGVQIMQKGSQPTDSGLLSHVSPGEVARTRDGDPSAAKYLRRVIGAEELINGVERWCFWLEGADPADVRNSAELRQRVEGVQKFRLSSKKSKTRDDAQTPHLFQERRQPFFTYLAVPSVSSESRRYVPMALFPPDVIASNALLTIDNADLFTFGVLHGRPFQVWNATVSGRLKSDFRISAEITYNNYPWPEVDSAARAVVETAAQGVLAARDAHPGASLADLYGPLSMPADLTKAHQDLDKAVLTAYGLKPNATDAEVLAELFSRYEKLTSPLGFGMTSETKIRSSVKRRGR